ncbi:MAG: hypothetical protein AAB767_00940, partial [Patescibacteria group bacterium]
VKFYGNSKCYLLKKGRSRFENTFLEEVSEGPVTHTANVTLLTDAGDAVLSPASEEKAESQPVNDDTLEKVLADINLSSTNAEKENQNEAPSRIDGGTDAAAIDDAPAAIASSLNKLQDASEKDKEKLVQAGYKTTEDLAQAPVAQLIQGLGVSLRKAANWINQARRKTGEIRDEGATITKDNL